MTLDVMDDLPKNVKADGRDRDGPSADTLGRYFMSLEWLPYFNGAHKCSTLITDPRKAG